MSETSPEAQLSAPELLQIIRELTPDVLDAVSTDYIYGSELVETLRLLTKEATNRWSDAHSHDQDVTN